MSKLDELGNSNKRITINSSTPKKIEDELELMRSKLEQLDKKTDKRDVEYIKTVYELKDYIRSLESRLENKLEREVLAREKGDIENRNLILDEIRRVTDEMYRIKDTIRSLVDEIKDIKVQFNEKILKLDQKVDKVSNDLQLTMKESFIAVEAKLISFDDRMNQATLDRDTIKMNLKNYEKTFTAEFMRLEHSFDVKVHNLNVFVQDVVQMMKDNMNQIERKFTHIEGDMRNLQTDIQRVGVENQLIKQQAMNLLDKIKGVQENLIQNMINVEYSAEAIGHRVSSRIKDEMLHLQQKLSQNEKRLLEIGHAEEVAEYQQTLDLEELQRKREEMQNEYEQEMANAKNYYMQQEQMLANQQNDVYMSRIAAGRAWDKVSNHSNYGSVNWRESDFGYYD